MKTLNFIIVAALVSLAAQRPSSAGSATWATHPTSGDWNTAANWTNGVPTPADDVCIFAGIPQVGAARPVIRSLYAPSTPLALAGDFTVTGTATVQTALHDKPMVIVYRVSPLTYQLGRRLVTVDTIGMVNLIAG